jgi:ABC-2 type transport system ATP-binding protein
MGEVCGGGDLDVPVLNQRFQTSMSESNVIEVNDLTKRYGRLTAVDGVSFSVREGEIFGLIGPNGAGKTTSMECIEGIRKPNGGSVRVLDVDPYSQSAKLRDRIGVQLQDAQLQKRIKVWEAVDLMASLYSQPVDANALLERLGLASKTNTWFMNLSGGQKQRLFIALALINEPEVVFLDELTTGLDPQARRAIWELVEGIKRRGKTVFLTTHLMEEAERLCDRVAIIEHGKVIAIGTPAELVSQHCPEVSVSISCEDGFDAAAITQAIPGIAIESKNGKVILSGEGDDFVTEVIRYLAHQDFQFRDLHTHRPNLEDVFLKLTGHSVRD